jgi:hypothetical protein
LQHRSTWFRPPDLHYRSNTRKSARVAALIECCPQARIYLRERLACGSA